jgi:hypothetical protein
VQHLPSQLCTSSNTSSIQKNVTNGTSLLISNEGKLAFHLANFILRSAWVNWHNSSWGCNLEKLINQSELNRGLVFNTRIMAWVARDEEVMRKLANVTTGFPLHAKNNQVLEKKFQGSMNKQGRTSRGSDLHSGPTRGSDMKMCHLWTQGAWKIYNMIQK